MTEASANSELLLRTGRETLRLERAKQLLESTRMTLDSITYAVGYEDSNSFRRLFVQRVGLLPVAYRTEFQPAQSDSAPSVRFALHALARNAIAIASKRDLTQSAVFPGIAKVRARCRHESQCAASGWHSAASGRGRMISRPAVAITNGTTSAL